MKTWLPPDGSLLTAEQQAFLATVYQSVSQAEFRKSLVDSLLPSIIDGFALLCPSDSDLLLVRGASSLGSLVPR